MHPKITLEKLGTTSNSKLSKRKEKVKKKPIKEINTWHLVIEPSFIMRDWITADHIFSNLSLEYANNQHNHFFASGALE